MKGSPVSTPRVCLEVVSVATPQRKTHKHVLFENMTYAEGGLSGALSSGYGDSEHCQPRSRDVLLAEFYEERSRLCTLG